MTPEIREGVLWLAQQIGAKPEDVATMISYETGGTFDALKKGPTTQWGQHRGLLQWGEPQAKQYGIDWNDVKSQFKGAAQYFRDAGFKPGMGMMDLYSAVNAGRVGRYNASDANNGGAPGTVADKVNNQMAGHRRKGMALLGMEGPAQPVGAGPSGPGASPAYDPLSSIGAPSQSPSQGPGEAVAATPWDYISGNRGKIGAGLSGFSDAMSSAAPEGRSLRDTRMTRMNPVQVEGASYVNRKQPDIMELLAQLQGGM